MFKFEHEPEEVNLIIQALEHKIRSMQAFYSAGSPQAVNCFLTRKLLKINSFEL